MIRFALFLFVSLAVSSQAVAAIKWNNPGSNSGTKQVPSCDHETGRNYQTREDIIGDGLWLDKDTKRALSQIALNGLEKKLNLNARNIDRQDVLSFTKKAGRNAAKFSKDISLTGNVGGNPALHSDTRFS